MKIRSDFVTNSSSSSYIIAYRNISDIKTDDVKVQKLIDVYNHLVKVLFTGDECDVIRTVDELNEYYLSIYSYGDTTLDEFLRDNDWISSRYYNHKRLMEDGYQITNISIEYSDEYFGEILDLLDDGENIIVECFD